MAVLHCYEDDVIVTVRRVVAAVDDCDGDGDGDGEVDSRDH